MNAKQAGDSVSGVDDDEEAAAWREELSELLSLHCPPFDGYDGRRISKPLPEVDEIRCMLAQEALRRGDVSGAQVHYRKLGLAGGEEVDYFGRLKVRPEDWPMVDLRLGWVDKNSDALLLS